MKRFVKAVLPDSVGASMAVVVTVRRVVVTFEKVDGGRICRWTAVRTKRRSTGGHMGVGHGQLPHDLVQFVVEAELGLTRGFWGSIEQGATFKSGARKRTTPGRDVIRRNRSELDEAEHLANAHWRAWQDGEPTPMRTRLDDVQRQWAAVPDGGALRLDWRPDV